jgi:chromosomal replication initiation ATPase DnaA
MRQIVTQLHPQMAEESGTFNRRYRFDLLVGEDRPNRVCNSESDRRQTRRNLQSAIHLGPFRTGKSFAACDGQSGSAHPELIVWYLSGENFMIEVIDSIRNDRRQQLRDRTRRTNVLLMDDVQFLAEGEAQEELFHVFDEFYNAQKQLVFASDRPPAMIPTRRVACVRLRGLVLDLQEPNVETKWRSCFGRTRGASISRRTGVVLAERASNVRWLSAI